MKAEEIKILLDKVYRPVCKIEDDLGMPKTTLQKAIKGKRSLPKRWSIELKEYVKIGGWIAANVKEKAIPEELQKSFKSQKKPFEGAVGGLLVPNQMIPPMPVKEKGEDSIDFAARKSEWKKKYNL